MKNFMALTMTLMIGTSCLAMTEEKGPVEESSIKSRPIKREPQSEKAAETTATKNLTHLDLSYKYTGEICMKPMQQLPNLQHLDLTACDLHDPECLSFLSNCRNLQSLRLDRNQLPDLSHIPALESLTRFSLSYNFSLLSPNWTCNIAGISRLSNLQVLNLSGTPIKHSLFFLTTLEKLTELNATATELSITSAGTISKFTSLRRLNVSQNSPTMLRYLLRHPLAQLTHLQRLHMNNMSGRVHGAHIQELKKLTQLTALHMSHNTKINEVLLSLSRLSNLQELSIPRTPDEVASTLQMTLKNLRSFARNYDCLD